MRILYTFAGGSGHVEPLLALARASQAAGHVVAFCGRPWMVTKVEALGFPCYPAGSDQGLTPIRRPLVPVDVEKEIRALGAGFAYRIPRERATDLLPLCKKWQPDLIVCEEMDFGAMIVAERLNIPYASVLVIASGALVRADVVTNPLNNVRAAYDLPPDPSLTMLSRYLVLSPFPVSFRDPAFPLPTTAHSIRPLLPASVAPAQTWLTQLPDAPTVYFTLGTVFNVESGDLFQRVLTGLRDLPINLIVTVGRDIDPSEFGEQPTNVHIEQFVPQAVLLPHCDVVVSHGGSGSVVGALLHGLPMVILPMGADQPLNADRCVTLGVGLALDVMTLTPSDMREAVTQLIQNPAYRHAAARLQAEIDALPASDHAVYLLEQLMTTH